MHFDVNKLNSLKSTMISQGLGEDEMIYFMVAGHGNQHPYINRRYLCYFASSIGNLPTGYSKAQWGSLLNEQFNKNSYYQETSFDEPWVVEGPGPFIESDVTHVLEASNVDTVWLTWNGSAEEGEFRPILESSGYPPLAGVDLDGHNVIDLILPDEDMGIFSLSKTDPTVVEYIVKTDYNPNWNSSITPNLDIKIDLSKMDVHSLLVVKQYVFDEEIPGDWLANKAKFSSINVTKTWGELNLNVTANSDLEELKTSLWNSLGLRHLNTTLDGTIATLSFRSEKGKSRQLQSFALDSTGKMISIESQSNNEDGVELTTSSGEVTGYWVQNAFIDYVSREKEFVHFKNMDPTNELKVTLTATDEDSVIETYNDEELKWVEENGERNFCLMNDYCQDSYHKASFVIDLEALEVDKKVIVRSQNSKELLAEATIPELNTGDDVADVIKGVLEKTGLVVTYNPYPLPIDGESAPYEFVLENNTLEYISFDLGIPTQDIQEHQYLNPETNRAKLTITNKEILDTNLSIQCCLIPAPVEEIKPVIGCEGALPYTIVHGIDIDVYSVKLNDVELPGLDNYGTNIIEVLEDHGVLASYLIDTKDTYEPYFNTPRSPFDIYMVNTTDEYIRLEILSSGYNGLSVVAKEQLQPDVDPHITIEDIYGVEITMTKLNLCLAPFNGISCIPSSVTSSSIETEVFVYNSETPTFLSVTLKTSTDESAQLLNYYSRMEIYELGIDSRYLLTLNTVDIPEEYLNNNDVPRYLLLTTDVITDVVTGYQTVKFTLVGGYYGIVRDVPVEPIADDYEMQFQELQFYVHNEDTDGSYWDMVTPDGTIKVLAPFNRGLTLPQDYDTPFYICRVTNPHIAEPL